MHANSRYALVGASVLTLLTGIVITILWLSVGLNDKEYRKYAVYVNEPVVGLSAQASVKFNGVDVGFVKYIDINRLNPQQVFLLLNVEQGTPITVSTIAVLQSQGITGVRYVELQATNNTTERLKRRAGEPFPVIRSKPSLMVQLDAALNSFTRNFANISKAITHILDKENAESLKQTLQHLDQVSGVFASQSDNLDRLIKNLTKTSETLPALAKHLVITADAFDHMAAEVREAGRRMKHTMATGQQLFETVNDQSVPQFTEMVDKFEDAGQQASQLAHELKRNPSMLIRGRTPAKLGPGEQ